MYAQNLGAEVASLRDQLEREQSETNATLVEYSKRIESATQENKKLQMKLMRSQLRDSAKDSEVAVVKKEVLEKTAAIEQVMRDLQQRQQATLSRVKNVASAMVTACQAPSRETASPGQVSRVLIDGLQGAPNIHSGGGFTVPDGIVANAPADEVRSVLTGFSASLPNGRSPTAASSPPRRREAVNSRFGTSSPSSRTGARHDLSTAVALVERGAEDADEHRWFQSVKNNLEHFGNVDVFFDNTERDCSACLEVMGTPYGIRPRKCQHVFHIECLLQWWTEGTCPVCSSSFAPDPDRLAVRDTRSPSPMRSATGAAVGSPSMPAPRSIMPRPAAAPAGVFRAWHLRRP